MANKSYTQIQQQIEALSKEAERLRQAEINEVVAKIKEAIAVYSLTAADLGLASEIRRRGAKAAGRRASHAEAKYQDGHGNTWGGRGPRPRWLREALDAGHALSDFAV